MLDAQKAREKSFQCDLSNRKKVIEKAIENNIKKGRTEFKIMGSIPQDIKEELESNGYIVEEQESPSRITYIRW